jgi:hypothetical protein
VAVFGAQAEHVHVHDEIEATGGTLYYLSHTEVTEGSAQVSLVVKDRITGNVLARVPQRLGVEVVVKEFEGRLMFTRPIASVWDDGSLIGDARLQGHPVTIEVDYETPGRVQEKAAMGGRVTQDVGGRLTLGTTIVDDAAGAGDYRLRGADFTLKPVKGTRLLAELARSSGETGRAFHSSDGGLQFAEADGRRRRRGHGVEDGRGLRPRRDVQPAGAGDGECVRAPRRRRLRERGRARRRGGGACRRPHDAGHRSLREAARPLRPRRPPGAGASPGRSTAPTSTACSGDSMASDTAPRPSSSSATRARSAAAPTPVHGRGALLVQATGPGEGHARAPAAALGRRAVGADARVSPALHAVPGGARCHR